MNMQTTDAPINKSLRDNPARVSHNKKAFVTNKWDASFFFHSTCIISSIIPSGSLK